MRQRTVLVGKRNWLAALITGLVVLAVVLVVSLFLIKILWVWTIPDLFPGGVAQGLVAKEISWFTSFKLAIFIAVLAAIAGIRSQKQR